jgi:hypothetical protein
LPPTSAVTPVTRPRPTAGPSWLDGSDPNVLPAGTSQPDPRGKVQQVGATTVRGGKDDPSFITRGIEKFKSVTSNDKPLISGNTQPTPNSAESPNPNTPFRGVTQNGAPVYAGPPAYRWYGWGTVTPGANPLAPTGQYPRASAQWYSITGATPGAIPVPVTNPGRATPGSEPPAYLPAAVTRQPVPMPTLPPQPVIHRAPPAVSRYDAPQSPSKFAPPSEPGRLTPTVNPVTVPVSVPTLPVPKPSVPVGVPTLTPLPAPTSVVPPPADVAPAAESQPAKLVNVAPPVLPPLPVAVEQPIVKPAPPKPKDDVQWQSSPDTPATPAREPGTWGPAGGKPTPAAAPGAAPTWEPGATDTTRRPVARGQAPDTNPQADAAVNLIHAVCRGRAGGVEVRWASTTKLAVCFEAKTEAEAGKLVKDVSARPELKPYQIDFCVFVK